MTCDHAGCTEEATVQMRFGDGTFTLAKEIRRQNYTHYCDPHAADVDRLFHVCDVGPVGHRSRSYGLLQERISDRHAGRVAPSP